MNNADEKRRIHRMFPNKRSRKAMNYEQLAVSIKLVNLIDKAMTYECRGQMAFFAKFLLVYESYSQIVKK